MPNTEVPNTEVPNTEVAAPTAPRWRACAWRRPGDGHEGLHEVLWRLFGGPQADQAAKSQRVAFETGTGATGGNVGVHGRAAEE